MLGLGILFSHPWGAPECPGRRVVSRQLYSAPSLCQAGHWGTRHRATAGKKTDAIPPRLMGEVVHKLKCQKGRALLMG